VRGRPCAELTTPSRRGGSGPCGASGHVCGHAPLMRCLWDLGPAPVVRSGPVGQSGCAVVRAPAGHHSSERWGNIGEQTGVCGGLPGRTFHLGRKSGAGLRKKRERERERERERGVLLRVDGAQLCSVRPCPFSVSPREDSLRTPALLAVCKTVWRMQAPIFLAARSGGALMWGMNPCVFCALKSIVHRCLHTYFSN